LNVLYKIYQGGKAKGEDAGIKKGTHWRYSSEKFQASDFHFSSMDADVRKKIKGGRPDADRWSEKSTPHPSQEKKTFHGPQRIRKKQKKGALRN